MSEEYNVVALLPMKANSERVPNKNFRELAGKPLFLWVLEKLLHVDSIDKVVINTDARGILEEFEEIHNSKVILRDRPESICGDMVSMNAVLENDVNNINSKTYLMTHTTNPFIEIGTIEECIEIFIAKMANEESDSLFTVNKVQTRFYRKDGSPVNHDPENLLRTQDLEPWYEENSNLYLFSKDSFLQTNARIGKRPYLYVMNTLESLDIDGPDDWDLAQTIAENNA